MSRAAKVVTVLCVGALGGCEAILGLDDYGMRAGTSGAAGGTSSAGGDTASSSGGDPSTTGPGTGGDTASSSGGDPSTTGPGTGGGGAGGGGGTSGPCRTVFVTSKPFAPMGGYDAAVKHCKSLSPDKEWVPWLSTSTIDAGKQVGKGSFCFAMVKTAVVATNDGTTTTLLEALSADEGGNLVSSGKLVWTGTKTDGTPFPDTCTNWTAARAYGHVGVATEMGTSWTDKEVRKCNEAGIRLYCFEKSP